MEFKSVIKVADNQPLTHNELQRSKINRCLGRAIAALEAIPTNRNKNAAKVIKSVRQILDLMDNTTFSEWFSELPYED